MITIMQWIYNIKGLHGDVSIMLGLKYFRLLQQNQLNILLGFVVFLYVFCVCVCGFFFFFFFVVVVFFFWSGGGVSFVFLGCQYFFIYLLLLFSFKHFFSGYIILMYTYLAYLTYTGIILP